MTRFLLLALFLSIPVAWAQQASKATEKSFPKYEDYLVDDRGLDKYSQDAIKFLQTNGNSRYAPRVAGDLYMISQVANEKKLRQLMLTYLFYYRSRPTIPAQAIIKGFAAGVGFRDEMLAIAEELMLDGNPRVASGFARAMLQAHRQFGGELFSDWQAALKCCCILQWAGEKNLTTGIRQRLQAAKLEKEDRALVDAVLGTGTPTDKLIKLYQSSSTKTTFYLLAHLRQLPPEQRKVALHQEILAFAMLDAKRFRAAQEMIRRFPEPKAQHRYWLAVAALGQRDVKGAIAELNELVKVHPQDPWAKAGEQLLPALSKLTDSRQKLHSLAGKLLVSAKQGTEALRMTFDLKMDGGVLKIHSYLNVKDQIFYFALKENNELAFAHKGRGKQAWFYRKEAGKTLKVDLPQFMVPVPSLKIEESPNGELVGSHGINLGTFEEARESMRRILAMPQMSQKGVQRLVDRMLFRQWTVPVVDEANAKITFHQIELKKPTLESVSATFDNNGLITSLVANGLGITDIQIGKADAVPAGFAEWPGEAGAQASDVAEFWGAWMSIIKSIIKAAE